MLPILLFEVAWKTLWFAVVALPHLLADDMNSATQDMVFSCSLVVLVVAVVPWGYTRRRYVRTPGDIWRRQEVAERSALA